MEIFAVVSIVTLHVIGYSSSKPATINYRHDVHTYMDVPDLQYHFGSADIASVPNYDVITPQFHPAYRDFPVHVRDPTWVYPAELELYLDAFDTRHRVQAVRNDYLFDPNLTVTYYKSDKSSGAIFKPSASQLQRFYLTRVTPVNNAFDIPNSETNGALAFSPDGMQGIFEASNRLLRIVPLRPRFKEKFKQTFDVHLEKETENAGTHIIYELSKAETGDENHEFDVSSRRNTNRRKSYSGIRASLKMAVIADHTVYQTMVDWQFMKPENQLFLVLAFYNEVQAMYRERVLRRQVRLHITLKSVGFFQSPQNDLGADPHAEQYLKNLCEGPYNHEDYDHVQALTYLDIYDKNKKRKRREMEFDQITLPEAKRNDRIRGWRPTHTDPRSIPETHKAYDTIGLAWIGSTCNQRRHCSLVEMNSPMASLSGAHELGHSLGMHHEEQLKECRYNPKDPDRSSFMSSHSSGGNPWATKGTLPSLTRCTTQELIKALNGANRCLVRSQKDKIERQFSFKTHFLGVIVRNPLDATDLCRLLLGPVWMTFKKVRKNQIQKIYSPPTETGDALCRSLDCKVVGVDNPSRQFGVKFGPAMAGTACSPNKDKICYNFKCIDKDAIGKLD
ncbi:A disintegrin and metalloproteinase with thrombospondin motifs 19-like [Paramacrobiotus metropolitanus]|uniref:A disintegrin and metalloproteinase with thrombospondin motifs 19-like n=1 Tax=Paramacrobiotus metropolitanus TaxID=2943436 RepID=UPI0024463CEC|nr:A disintegrin and metalloproteinase with thrombospondin motifs 19-like [Paramacrobiotus metropolitanus]